MSINVLTENSYLASHEIVTGGAMGVTRLASIEWDDGTIKKCYIKVYPTHDRIRKLCNELTGFTLGKALGILQPDNAALIPLSKLFYKDFSDVVDLNSNETVWAWVTTECGQSVKGIFHLNDFENLFKNDPDNAIAKLIQAYSLVCNQKNLPNIIAFDDFIANDDRNIGNVVMIGDGNMGIIDHGEILGSVNWFSDLLALDKTLAFNNKLLNILNDQPSVKTQTKFTTKHLAVEAANKHKDAFISVQDILTTWWKNLLEVSNIPTNDQPKYIEYLKDFLHYRSIQSTTVFANRLGLVA
ncbi:hypothetical protein P255_00999 [Acinetobacter brisouii CIP 110357]|uniref:Aminoglycoside phosphotransferase domain-containing protein n=1 Tax=Acinetobacter brisouii CIP 110357 TaxID=1341683 RepID=V2VVY5_9GAMM|nr:hypothetical protein [Acinetobacter brisouii]ENV48120.1 hypothetical protein F954_01187 [Acinetobacter brisouii ANC 4119]ESK51904.1 hypothetical protein P255_00999 [Acinetobacter brisouii CIP 110357]